MNTVVSLASVFYLLVLICFAVWMIFSDRRIRRDLSQPFCASGWREITSRWKMVADIRRNQQLVALRLEQVVDRFGEPDEDDGRIEAFFKHSDKSKYDHLTYRLSDAEDCDWLVLHLDDSNHVVDCSEVWGS